MLVALYARVSTTRQAENDLSIPDQLRQLRDWCAANGHSIVREFVEPGASATDDKRPIFQAMIADALTKPTPYDAIVIHSLSRFFRDGLEFGLYERKLGKNKVKVSAPERTIAEANRSIEAVTGAVDQGNANVRAIVAGAPRTTPEVRP